VWGLWGVRNRGATPAAADALRVEDVLTGERHAPEALEGGYRVTVPPRTHSMRLAPGWERRYVLEETRVTLSSAEELVLDIALSRR
jgi:hypothetical protein